MCDEKCLLVVSKDERRGREVNLWTSWIALQTRNYLVCGYAVCIPIER